VATRDFIALDLGQKRTGIARASTIAKLAEPLTTVETAKLMSFLNSLALEKDVAAIVVGLPRNQQGEETEQSRWTMNWVRQAKIQIDKPFYCQDEALSTRDAEKYQKASKSNHEQDAIAAAIILQDFLNTTTDKRVVC
jgi:putative holliday junction resolvase